MSDVSAGGLGFHVIARVPRSGTVRFWYSLQTNHRIEATGELVWTDETRKKGGLRFTSLSNEGHQNSWTHQSITPPTTRKTESFPKQIHMPARASALIPNRLCPNCGNQNVHKSHKRGFVEKYLLRLLLLCPYRCDACYHRFYRMN